MSENSETREYLGYSAPSATSHAASTTPPGPALDDRRAGRIVNAEEGFPGDSAAQAGAEICHRAVRAPEIIASW